MMDHTQIQAYLKRIGYNGSLAPSTETLQQLQANHLYKVPFENLDIHLDRGITHLM